MRQEAINQGIDVIQGERHDLSLADIGQAGITGGVFGAGASAAGQIGAKLLTGMKVKPTDLGLEFMADNPEYLKAWDRAVERKLQSTRPNRVKEYVDAMKENKTVDPELAKGVYDDVREFFKEELGDELADAVGEIHHWNYPKGSTYQRDIVDPKKLVVTKVQAGDPKGRIQHSKLHEATSTSFWPKGSMNAPVKPTQAMTDPK
jgi:hypothetical protein